MLPLSKSYYSFGQNLLRSYFRPTSKHNVSQIYNFTKRNVSRKSLIMSEHGEPAQVLEMIEDEVQELDNDEVLLKVLMAPINPSDINTIQGKYPLLPKLPGTPGNEFVAEVMAVGTYIKDLDIGQRVVPFYPGLGSWRSHMVVKRDEVFAIPNKMDLVAAATVTINPCTAYRMLNDFVKMRVGDVVIQNAANGSVGRMVHQMCKMWGLKSVGVIRDRPNVVLLKEELKRLGATEIYTEEEIACPDIFTKCITKPILALNCVGGRSAEMISQHLSVNGVMVTYGGMSRQPFMVSPEGLIFQQQKFLSFWIAHWNRKFSRAPRLRKAMLDDVIGIVNNQNFMQPKTQLIPLEKYKKFSDAFSLDVSTGVKFILDMSAIHQENENENEEANQEDFKFKTN